MQSRLFCWGLTVDLIVLGLTKYCSLASSSANSTSKLVIMTEAQDLQCFVVFKSRKGIMAQQCAVSHFSTRHAFKSICYPLGHRLCATEMTTVKQESNQTYLTNMKQ